MSISQSAKALHIDRVTSTSNCEHRFPAGSPHPLPLTVDVVRGMDELVMAMTMRSLCFLGEQASPWDEEFDGNDFCATHVLARVGHEPAGALRIRWFADWAKIERLALRRDFRGQGIADHLAEFAVDLIRRKGYRYMLGHAQERLLPFWERHGYRAMGGPETYIVYADHVYVPMIGELAPHPDRLGIDADHMTVVRPEGRWHIPGPFDLSADRPATCPHDDGRRAA